MIENAQDDNTYRVTVADGKYTVILPKEGGMYALRHGERWRDLTGDGMVLALVAEIDKLRGELYTPKTDKPDKAHVIRCNGEVEHVVVGDIAQAKEKMETMAKVHWLAEHPPMTQEEYRNQYFWNIHSVGVS